MRAGVPGGVRDPRRRIPVPLHGGSPARVARPRRRKPRSSARRVRSRSSATTASPCAEAREHRGVSRAAGSVVDRQPLVAVRRARPRSGVVSQAARSRPRRGVPLLQGDRRRHRRPRVRVQTADRVLRLATGRAGARGAVHLHPRHVPRRDVDPRRQARRHRLDGRALRPRSVRPLPRPRRDREPVSRSRLGGAVLRAWRRRDRPVPHQQSRRRRPAVARLRGPAALRAGRRDGRQGMDERRRLRVGRRRHVSRRTARRPRGDRRSADPGAGHRRPGWRCPRRGRAPARRPTGGVWS